MSDLLTQPDYRGVTAQIRAAITAGIRPCAMVFHEQPNEPWNSADFRLLEAYQLLQDETCGHCGQPVWLCRNEVVQWEVRSDVCAADSAIDQWYEKNKDKKTPGEHPYAVPYVVGFDDDGIAKYDYDNLPSRSEFLTQKD